MKTSELQGAALDWAVAKCEGFEILSDGISWIIDDAGTYKQLPGYSISWTQGGPIIERERIQCSPGLPHDEHTWSAIKYDHIFDDNLDCFSGGSTPLIAAMRCYVTSKLGDEIELPEELK